MSPESGDPLQSVFFHTFLRVDKLGTPESQQNPSVAGKFKEIKINLPKGHFPAQTFKKNTCTREGSLTPAVKWRVRLYSLVGCLPCWRSCFLRSAVFLTSSRTLPRNGRFRSWMCLIEGSPKPWPLPRWWIGRRKIRKATKQKCLWAGSWYQRFFFFSIPFLLSELFECGTNNYPHSSLLCFCTVAYLGEIRALLLQRSHTQKCLEH